MIWQMNGWMDEWVVGLVNDWMNAWMVGEWLNKSMERLLRRIRYECISGSTDNDWMNAWVVALLNDMINAWMAPLINEWMHKFLDWWINKTNECDFELMNKLIICRKTANNVSFYIYDCVSVNKFSVLTSYLSHCKSKVYITDNDQNSAIHRNTDSGSRRYNYSFDRHQTLDTVYSSLCTVQTANLSEN